MANFDRLKSTLAYARLGLVSLTAVAAPIAGAAQELCGTDLFVGEPDSEKLMSDTLDFLNILETNGVVAFEGSEGRMSVDLARQALQEGVGSARLLACVVNSASIEFAFGSERQVIHCDSSSLPAVFQTEGPSPTKNAAQLFCSSEVATISKFLGSES